MDTAFPNEPFVFDPKRAEAVLAMLRNRKSQSKLPEGVKFVAAGPATTMKTLGLNTYAVVNSLHFAPQRGSLIDVRA